MITKKERKKEKSMCRVLEVRSITYIFCKNQITLNL